MVDLYLGLDRQIGNVYSILIPLSEQERSEAICMARDFIKLHQDGLKLEDVLSYTVRFPREERSISLDLAKRYHNMILGMPAPIMPTSLRTLSSLSANIEEWGEILDLDDCFCTSHHFTEFDVEHVLQGIFTIPQANRRQVIKTARGHVVDYDSGEGIKMKLEAAYREITQD